HQGQAVDNSATTRSDAAIARAKTRSVHRYCWPTFGAGVGTLAAIGSVCSSERRTYSAARSRRFSLSDLFCEMRRSSFLAFGLLIRDKLSRQARRVSSSFVRAK